MQSTCASSQTGPQGPPCPTSGSALYRTSNSANQGASEAHRDARNRVDTHAGVCPVSCHNCCQARCIAVQHGRLRCWVWNAPLLVPDPAVPLRFGVPGLGFRVQGRPVSGKRCPLDRSCASGHLSSCMAPTLPAYRQLACFPCIRCSPTTLVDWLAQAGLNVIWCGSRLSSLGAECGLRGQL